MNAIDSIMQTLINDATRVTIPLAVTIPGWNHDLITARLRNRGVVFNVKNKYGPPSEEEGNNKEGKWIVMTERFRNPHSVVIFKPIIAENKT